MSQDRPTRNAIKAVYQNFILALDTKEVRYSFVDAALFIAGLITLIVGTLATFLGKEVLAATTLAAGLALLFASTIDRFEFLKALGVEAKVAKLNEQISKAEEALGKLKKMTELTAKTLVDVNCKMGRSGYKRTGNGPTSSDLILLESSVREMMNDVGCDQQAIASTLRKLAAELCHDMAVAHLSYFVGSHQNLLNKLGSELRDNKGQPEFHALGERMRVVRAFQEERINKVHSFELEDYPEKFMDILDDVPEISDVDIAKVRESAERFVSGMNSLRNGQSLSDQELWIETFDRAEIRSIFD